MKNRVKELRKAKKIQKSTVYKKFNKKGYTMNYRRLYAIERNERQPLFEEIAILIEILKCSFDELIQDESNN